MPRRRMVGTRFRPVMKMGYILPLRFLRNPLKGGTKIVTAGVTFKKGAAVYFNVRF